MSDEITTFKVTEKALLSQAVTFNEWSLAMIEEMINEIESSLMGGNQPVEEDRLEKMLRFLEQEEVEPGAATQRLTEERS